MCSADGFPIPLGFAPPVWISNVDATDLAAGVHCQPITSVKGVSLAAKSVRLMIQLMGEVGL